MSVSEQSGPTDSAGRAGASRTAGQVIFAVGDIHGRYDLLLDMTGKIARDAETSIPAGQRPVVVFCGDYVDRGPDSAKVVEALIWLQSRADFRLRFLKGNHEQAMLRFVEDPAAGRDWLGYGGAETLASYGAEPPDVDDDEASLIRARDVLLKNMPAAHLRFLETLELTVEIGDYAFVHAGVRPGLPLAGQTEHDLLWIRQSFLADPGPFEKVIVHGHTWLDDQPRLLSHRIAIDTGSYATGVLTAVRLEHDGVATLQARGAPGFDWT